MGESLRCFYYLHVYAYVVTAVCLHLTG